MLFDHRVSSNWVADEQPEGEQTTRGVVGGTRLFDRFVLQKVLGRGGMGVVWLAQDERLDRLVALKVVPESVSFDPSTREELKRETRKCLMLTHPHIVRIFDFIEDAQSAAISMEYVDGATLSSLRVKKPSKCFDVDEIAPWVASLCDALTYAHESAHLVHRDLKPSNLMVNSKNELKITDFGIACTLRESMTYVSVRTSSGTLNYMSPQQLLGEDPAASDDIYALGATLYEMLSSKPPFFGGDVASQVREVVPPTIALRRTKFGITGAPVPKYWEETIAACLQKNAEQRPRTAAELARRLRLSGPVRLKAEPKPKFFLSEAIAFAKTLDRKAILTGTAVALVATWLFSFHSSKSVPAVTDKLDRPNHPVGYAIEKPASAPPSAQTVREVPATTAPTDTDSAPQPVSASAATESSPSAPPPATSKDNAKLQLTTTPAGASFSIYSGVIANKTMPSSEPLRSGTTPGDVEDLPPGRYTLFFHNDGWADDRAEISVGAGESVPVDYAFPHGTANIVSNPPGVEIFLGKRSLGATPLTVDLPLGKQKLVARVSAEVEKTQFVTVGPHSPVNVVFDTKVHSSGTHSKAKATPTPSALDKIGQSLKHVFSSKPTPTPHKKR